MSKKEIRLGKFILTPTDPYMTFAELIEEIDHQLMYEIRRDRSGILWRLFDYFDSSQKNPLTPREFFEFLGSLDFMEEYYVMMFAESLPWPSKF